MSAQALRTELAACTVIARDALLAHPSKGGITLSRALAGFAILVTVLAFAFGSGKAFTGIMAAAGLSCGLLVILWWVLQEGDAAALLLHCQGSTIRAMSSLRVAAPLALFAALLIAAPALSATYRATPAFHFVMPTIAMLMQWMLARSMHKSLRATAVEQALVMLGARRPDAAGALLSRALMLRYGLAWLASTLTVLVVSALIGGSTKELSWMLAACLVTLTAALLLVRAPVTFPASVR
jgi:hypothetical protein